MRQYFFVLGKNPTLSFAEINGYLHTSNIKYFLVELSQELAVISTEYQFDSQLVMKTLGGTIKFGAVLDKVDLGESESKFQDVFSSGNLQEKYFPEILRKLHFGVSIYNCGDKNLLEKLYGQLKELNLTIKKNLQESGIKAGFLKIKERHLSSVSVAKNRLLDQGAEIVIILTKKSILIGKTLSVQEFASFSFRDYGRPERDKRSGIIPPKLARIMINISQADKNSILLDPFCGSGTIIQEGVLLEYKNIIGSDISSKAVLSAKKNLEWLFANFRNVDKSSYNIKWWVSDVKLLNDKLKEYSVDIIVTEPHLGPPLFGKPKIQLIQKILSELSSLYIAAFKIFFQILSPGGKIVIVFPVFEEDGKLHYVDIIDELSKLGFEKEQLIPPEFIQHPSISLSLRSTILYGDKNQFLLREILAFTKNSDIKV